MGLKKIEMTAVPASPVPEDKRVVTCEINRALYLSTKADAKARGHSMREAIEWGLRAYLLNHNAGLAKRLGIRAK